MSTHGSKELDEDAAKLEALGQDAGPTMSDIECLLCGDCGWMLDRYDKPQPWRMKVCIACGNPNNFPEPETEKWQS